MFQQKLFSGFFPITKVLNLNCLWSRLWPKVVNRLCHAEMSLLWNSINLSFGDIERIKVHTITWMSTVSWYLASESSQALYQTGWGFQGSGQCRVGGLDPAGKTALHTYPEPLERGPSLPALSPPACDPCNHKKWVFIIWMVIYLFANLLFSRIS